MKILIDLTHPSDAYFFRDLIRRLKAEGCEVRLTGRDKDIVVDVARELGFELEVFGTARGGLVNLGRELLARQWRLRRIVREFRPDRMLAFNAGPYVAPVGRFTGVETHVFYDSEHATIQNLMTYPFATHLYVPKCYNRAIRRRHVRFDGYKELAYLHPDRFTADESVLAEAGVAPGETFSIVRFVSWDAAHDIGHGGFTADNKLRAVKELAQFGKVFVSCEGRTPEELAPYRMPIRVTRMHDLMAFASLVFSEGATMVSEAAVLGVPSVYVNSLRLGYVDEQESRYGLVFNLGPERQDEAIAKGVEILSQGDRAGWAEKGRRLIDEKIDVFEMLYEVATTGSFSAE